MKEMLIITPAIKCCQEDAPDKGLDCAEEEGGDAEASATDDDKAASILDKQIPAIFGCRSNIMLRGFINAYRPNAAAAARPGSRCCMI